MEKYSFFVFFRYLIRAIEKRQVRSNAMFENAVISTDLCV